MNAEALKLSTYASPELLAGRSGAPIQVCRLLFAVAENDVENVALIRSGKIDEDTMRQRRAVILMARLRTDASYPEIARALARDHSSVDRSAWKALDLWRDDPEFRALCMKISGRERDGLEDLMRSVA